MATHIITATSNNFITINNGDTVQLPDIRDVPKNFLAIINMAESATSATITPVGEQQVNSVGGNLAVTSRRTMMVTVGIPTKSWNLFSTESTEEGGSELPDPADGEDGDVVTVENGAFVLAAPAGGGGGGAGTENQTAIYDSDDEQVGGYAAHVGQAVLDAAENTLTAASPSTLILDLLSNSQVNILPDPSTCVNKPFYAKVTRHNVDSTYQVEDTNDLDDFHGGWVELDASGNQLFATYSGDDVKILKWSGGSLVAAATLPANNNSAAYRSINRTGLTKLVVLDEGNDLLLHVLDVTTMILERSVELIYHPSYSAGNIHLSSDGTIAVMGMGDRIVKINVGTGAVTDLAIDAGKDYFAAVISDDLSTILAWDDAASAVDKINATTGAVIATSDPVASANCKSAAYFDGTHAYFIGGFSSASPGDIIAIKVSLADLAMPWTANSFGDDGFYYHQFAADGNLYSESGEVTKTTRKLEAATGLYTPFHTREAADSYGLALNSTTGALFIAGDVDNTGTMFVAYPAGEPEPNTAVFTSDEGLIISSLNAKDRDLSLRAMPKIDGGYSWEQMTPQKVPSGGNIGDIFTNISPGTGEWTPPDTGAHVLYVDGADPSLDEAVVATHLETKNVIVIVQGLDQAVWAMEFPTDELAASSVGKTVTICNIDPTDPTFTVTGTGFGFPDEDSTVPANTCRTWYIYDSGNLTYVAGPSPLPKLTNSAADAGKKVIVDRDGATYTLSRTDVNLTNGTDTALSAGSHLVTLHLDSTCTLPLASISIEGDTIDVIVADASTTCRVNAPADALLIGGTSTARDYADLSAGASARFMFTNQGAAKWHIVSSFGTVTPHDAP